MARGFEAIDRVVFTLQGNDTRDFLQNLVTNDVPTVPDGLIYAALLTPQGKYLADFFLFKTDEWHLDVSASQADDLEKRLKMYRLRADVKIDRTALSVWQVWDSEDGYTDPRHKALGRRVYGKVPSMEKAPSDLYTIRRINHGIPEAGSELISNESYILEMGFERLAGVDFKKGCYVGQEITARMKHKTSLRKGLAKLDLTSPVTYGTPVEADGKPVGQVLSATDTRALAYLRFDRANGAMDAGGVAVSLRE